MQRPLAGQGLLALAVFIASTEGASYGARSFLARDVAQKIQSRKQLPRVNWDYQQHGANWPGFCADDARQSPIDLPGLDLQQNGTSDLWFRYKNFEEPVGLYNDGFALSVTFHEKVGGIGVGESFTHLDESWSLQQMTVHAPSEHTWAGVHLPLELQLVHTPAQPGGELAIVSIGFSRGPGYVPNQFWSTLTGHGVPQYKGEEVQTNEHYGEELNFNELLSGSEFLMYEGSSTQPPCAPNARFFVRETPIDVPPDLIELVRHNIAVTTGIPDGNYRVPQPLNGRNVTRLHTKDGGGLETEEDFTARAMAEGPPTTAPSVPLLDVEKDIDHEDATRETDEVKLNYWYRDPTGDHVAAEKAKADSQNDIINAYNATMINENPDHIVSEMPDVTAAMTEVEATKVELTEAQTLLDEANRALLLARQARDFAEGRTNLTAAESGLMSAQDEVKEHQSVVDALENKLNTAKTALDDAKGTGHAQVWYAQQQLSNIGNALPSSHSQEAQMPMEYHLPSGSYTDPFSKNNAETHMRADGTLAEHLTQGLGPNHIHVTGTVTVGESTEDEDPVVTPAPEEVVSSAEEETAVVPG